VVHLRMFVRVEGRRWTCPISGTIGRGQDTGMLNQIRQLLQLPIRMKLELTMCTDVNSKSHL